jgi:hypothetical protein
MPETPTVEDARAALDVVLDVIVDFPFTSEHNKANYLAALVTPVLRVLVPPPYPLIAIGAPTAGSGKSLLAQVLRIVHGGVFRAEMRRDGAELQKQITTILDKTVGVYVVFDNVRGTVRSSVLEAVLTDAEYSDRLLGENVEVTAVNDRVWVITGNNLTLAGDLRRRTVWSWIDAMQEHPETRTGFRHKNLPAYVAKHRGDILAALVTMVAAWVQAGRPTGEPSRSDSFEQWETVTRGILTFAGFEGVVNHADSVRTNNLSDDDEAGTLFEALFRAFGDEAWTPAEAVQAIGRAEFNEDPVLSEDDLPLSLAEKMTRPGFSKSLGRWLADHDGQIHRGLTLGRATAKKWRVNHDLL